MRTCRQAGGITRDAILSRDGSSVTTLPFASVILNPRDFEPVRFHHFERRPLSIVAFASAALILFRRRFISKSLTKLLELYLLTTYKHRRLYRFGTS